ncbi:MAG: hypothetical protein IJ610_09495 [Bacteroidaceae bacterium]|nr:hypothetical protein [Bacteroidaceae bacterium]
MKNLSYLPFGLLVTHQQKILRFVILHFSLFTLHFNLPPSHFFSERTPASTAISHPCPPPSSTRHHLHLLPVSSSPSHLYQPQPRTRINLRLTLVLSLNEMSARIEKKRLPEA